MLESGNYYFLSFRNPDVPLNLGACIVQSTSVKDAIMLAHLLRINPGGDVHVYEMSEEGFKEQHMELNRLYSREEMLKMNFQLG